MEKLKNLRDVDHLRKGVYLLPNLLTTGALFAGFYAIIAAVNNLYYLAPVAIFIAMILDSLDGRVARLTNTQSEFGAEYDSLSDMVSFGIAPAVFAYSWSLHEIGKIGWLAAFCYVAATGLRLARFNIQVGTEKLDKKYFQGIPCTPAAGFIAGIIWMQDIYNLHGMFFTVFTSVAMIVSACLMVSNIRYRSFKDHDFKHHVPFFFILIAILILVGVTIAPPQVLFVIFTGYLLSGPVESLVRMTKKRRN